MNKYEKRELKEAALDFADRVWHFNEHTDDVYTQRGTKVALDSVKVQRWIALASPNNILELLKELSETRRQNDADAVADAEKDELRAELEDARARLLQAHGRAKTVAATLEQLREDMDTYCVMELKKNCL